MPTLQIKRGTDTEVQNYVGEEGELVKNTTTGRIHLMDGITSGGVELALLDDVGSGGGGGTTGIIDGFEDGDIAEYSGTTSIFEANTNTPVFDGTYSLQTTGTGGAIVSASGLDLYPSDGDTIRYRAYSPSNFETNSSPPALQFIFRAVDTSNFYMVSFSETSAKTWVQSSGSFTSLTEDTAVNVTNHTDEWLYGEISLSSGGSFTWTMFDSTDTEIFSISNTDTAVTGGSGIGFRQSSGTGATYDLIELI